jgi:hypothetical protein
MSNPKLTIEMVPRSCWYSNVRSEVSRIQWDVLRRRIYTLAHHVCEICGGVGPRHPVECHEVWDYNEATGIQKLIKMVALCPACHEVKHYGLAQVRGRGQEAIDHLANINDWSESEAAMYAHGAMDRWYRQSDLEWTLDITYLDELE